MTPSPKINFKAIFGLWCLLALPAVLVMMAFKAPWYYIIAFLGLAMLSILAAALDEKNKKAKSSSIAPVLGKDNTENDDPDYPMLVTQDDYFALLHAIKKLDKVCHRMSRDNDMRNNALNQANDKNTIQGDFGEKQFYEALHLMMAKDLFKCLEKMGYPIELDCEQEAGQALYVIVAALYETQSTTYDDFKFEIEHGKSLCRLMFENREQMLDVLTNNTVGITTKDIDDLSLAILDSLFGSETHLADIYSSMTDVVTVISHITDDPDNEALRWLKSLGEGDDRDVKKKEIVIKGNSTTSVSESTIADLDALIGLKRVKAEVSALNDFITVNHKRKEMGLKVPSVSYHCVFTGNPGTGKTTVARIVAGIYKQLGILEKGHLVETDRSGLVAEYLGQTAVKTNKVIDSALNGMLFIDEAYSLVTGSKEDYGNEAIATLLKRMEDDRDRLVVILAGYADEMERFIQSNPGLQSRFNRYIHFEDYSAKELLQIFDANMAKYDFKLSDSTRAMLLQRLSECVAHKDKDFGNARFVRNLFEKTIESQAVRLRNVSQATTEQLNEITDSDIEKAWQQIMRHKS